MSARWEVLEHEDDTTTRPVSFLRDTETGWQSEPWCEEYCQSDEMHKQSIAVLHRIVECLNACEGIEKPAENLATIAHGIRATHEFFSTMGWIPDSGDYVSNSVEEAFNVMKGDES